MGKMSVGCLIMVRLQESVDEELQKAHEAGFTRIQLGINDIALMRDPKYTRRVEQLIHLYGFDLTVVRAKWRAPAAWNLIDGPSTIGIVPAELRAARLEDIMHAARFAHELGCSAIGTHLGYLPLDPRDRDYVGTVQAVKAMTHELGRHGMRFLAETGQEPPVVLRRLLEDVGADNLFVNYDPANLITHGNANPVDGLSLLGQFVAEVHAKDGAYPANGHDIGKQCQVGKGHVDYPAFLRALRDCGFEGVLCIEWERDIWNQTQVDAETKRKEIAETKEYLERLLQEIYGGIASGARTARD